MGSLPAQVVAVILVTPISFLANKWWSFRARGTLPRSRTLAASNATAPASESPRLCVCVPTYNEVENIRPFVTALLGVFDSCRLDGTVLVVDDGSPDGTGRVADELAAEDRRVQVVHRSGKQGLGRAYRAGFTWALGRGYDLIAQMDCDFSHDPADLGSLVAAARGADVVLGSRYVDGGVVEAWPLSRRLISRAGSLYARLLLGLPIRDLTGGFKCFRREVLERIEHRAGAGERLRLSDRADAPRGACRLSHRGGSDRFPRSNDGRIEDVARDRP